MVNFNRKLKLRGGAEESKAAPAASPSEALEDRLAKLTLQDNNNDAILKAFPIFRNLINKILPGYGILFGVKNNDKIGHCLVLAKTKDNVLRILDAQRGVRHEFYEDEIQNIYGYFDENVTDIYILEAKKNNRPNTQLKFIYPTEWKVPIDDGYEMQTKDSLDEKPFSVHTINHSKTGKYPVLFPLNDDIFGKRQVKRKQRVNDCCICALDFLGFKNARRSFGQETVSDRDIERFFKNLYSEWDFQFNPRNFDSNYNRRSMSPLTRKILENSSRRRNSKRKRRASSSSKRASKTKRIKRSSYRTRVNKTRTKTTKRKKSKQNTRK